MALLERALPRFLPGSGPADGVFRDDVESILGWVDDLDSSFVAIQGPPGTGKTYSGAHIIHALISSGKRVGISAFGHAAIDNLLAAVHAVFEEKGHLELLCARRRCRTSHRSDLWSGVNYPGNPAAANAKYNLVAGTSWFFASPQMRDAPVDVLVIDEAGQLALADAVAASRSARNMILLGDPLQLAQVSKAVHPDGAGASVLEHVLGDSCDHSTEPRGVSGRDPTAASGDLRLHLRPVLRRTAHSHTGCAVRNIDGVEPGLVWIEAHHEGRSTESPEEAELVVNAILDLLGREWTHAEGEHSVLSAADFMVVAPYNDQVHLVREVLAEDDRTALSRLARWTSSKGERRPWSSSPWPRRPGRTCRGDRSSCSPATG